MLQQRALVVPAFEMTTITEPVPTANKSHLLDMIDTGSVRQFGAHVWPRGHAATNYARWQNAQAPYSVCIRGVM
jgi:glycosyltransferase-like protein LARGE